MHDYIEMAHIILKVVSNQLSSIQEINMIGIYVIRRTRHEKVSYKRN